MIENFQGLKAHPLFAKLALIQAQLDQADIVMENASFTRSPFQLISFLVSYAGLNSTDRVYVFNHLPKVPDINFSKEELDALIKDINWSAILENPKDSPLNFKLSIGISKPDLFFDCIKTNCPELLKALKNQNCLVQIEKKDGVVFTTQLDQTVTWTTPFHASAGAEYWKVPLYVLSEPLKEQIKNMAVGTHWSPLKDNTGFSVKKGNIDKIVLSIKAAQQNNTYINEVHDLEVNTGLYQAFKGLNHFYGLSKVDNVLVKLSNKATFSDKGASASQTQKVSYNCESTGQPSLENPTVIQLDCPLHVYYQGIDILATIGPGNHNLIEEEDSSKYYITLPTQEAQLGIRLYAAKLKPTQVHEINFNSDTLLAKNLNLGSSSSSSKASSASPSTKNKGCRTGCNFNFLFKLAMAACALIALTSLIVVVLALCSVISLTAGEIAIVSCMGVSALAKGVSCFFKRPTSGVPRVAVDESLIPENAMASRA